MVFSSGISDHELVGIVRKMHIKRFVPRKIFIRDYSQYNKEGFKTDLRNAPWENVFNKSNFNSSWNEFKNIFTNIVNGHVPLKEKIVCEKDTPWLKNARTRSPTKNCQKNG